MQKPNSLRVFMSFSVLSVLYLLLLVILPPNAATVQSYHLTGIEYHVLSLLLGLPRVIVWFAAFYGYDRLDYYTAAIRRTAEGAGFQRISYGLRWLAWGLPLSALVQNIAGGIAYAQNGFGTPATIITHFFNVTVSLVAFGFISSGTHLLLKGMKKQQTIGSIRAIMASFLAIGIAYCYATITTLAHQHANQYHMPMWLILLTVVFPYLYAWFMGLLAAYQIIAYRNHATGVLYTHALNLFAGGLALAIGSSILVQYITSTSAYLRRIELDWRLFLFYLLLIVYAAGFLLIAASANKLKKIEEV